MFTRWEKAEDRRERLSRALEKTHSYAVEKMRCLAVERGSFYKGAPINMHATRRQE